MKRFHLFLSACSVLQTYYYIAIIEDFFLRLAWVITVTAGEIDFIPLEIVKTVLAPLEVFRYIYSISALEQLIKVHVNF